MVRRDPDGATVLISLDVLLGGGDYQALQRQLQFRHTAPGLVRQLADKLRCSIGGDAVRSSFERVEVDDSAAFEEYLFGGARTLPAVVFSRGVTGGSSLASVAAECATRLAGVARCFIMDEEATWLIGDRLGKRWTVYNGAARIFHARVDTDDPHDHYEHPLFLNHRLNDFLAAADDLIRQTTTRPHQLPPVRSMFHSSAAAPGAGQDSAHSGAAAPTESLEAKISELAADIEGYEGLLREAATFETAAEKTIRQLTDEKETLQDRVEHLEEELAFAEGQLKAADILSFRYVTEHEAKDPLKFAAWAESVLSPFVVFAGRSFDGLSEFKDVSLDEGYFPRLSHAFFAIREVVRGGCSPTNLPEQYRGWQIEVTRCFSNRNDIKNFAGYEIQVDGENKNMEWHAKWGRSDDVRSSFRIYFHWDKENKRATVGHFPRHLSNNMSSRR